MNILYVVTKLELGGAQKHLISLIENIDKDKYQVFLFTASHGILWPDAEKIRGVKCRRSLFLDRPLNPVLDILAFFELLFFIKAHSISIVHTHSSKAGIAARIAAAAAGVRFVYHTVHGWSFNDCQNKSVRALYILLERIAAYFTTRIIVVSECDLGRGLANRISDPGRFKVIRYGIDVSAFERALPCLQQELGIPAGTLLAGTVSCFKPQKALHDFITVAADVCKRRDNVTFVIAGDGALRPALEDLISSAGLNGRIILLGWRRDIPQVLKSLDVFMLTSLWEGLPISAIEAMAASRPVVATDTGGISELIKDGLNGYLVGIRDTGAMSEKLSALLDDSVLRENMGRKAHDSLGEQYLTRYMANETYCIYPDDPAQ